MNLKQLARLEHIAKQLIEYDLGHILVDLGLIDNLGWWDKFLLFFARKQQPGPQRLVKLCESLGPSFIKLGQMLSVRPDLISPQYVKALESLQDNVNPVDFKDLQKLYKLDFAKVDPKPLASASVAQVHRAKLKSGKQVVVKMLRPHIREQISLDITILYHLATLIDKKHPHIQASKIVEEFEQWTMQELDFTKELEHIQDFAKYYKNSKVKYPKVYPKYSNHNILVLDYIDGQPIDKLSVKDAHIVFEQAFEHALNQVFEFGYFHADPHPGNFLVKNKTVYLIDFGIVGHFNDKLKEQTLDIFYAMLINDDQGVLDGILSMGLVSQPSRIPYVEKCIKNILRSMHAQSHPKIGPLMEKMLRCVSSNHIHVPREFVLFAKCIVMLEGVALKYDKKYNLIQAARPIIETLIRTQCANYIMKKGVSSTAKAVIDLPGHLLKVLRKVEDGTINVHIQDSDIKQLAVEVDKSSNRLAYAGIISALIVGGALLMTVPSISWSISSVVGVVFFFTAAALGFVLMRSVINEPK